MLSLLGSLLLLVLALNATLRSLGARFWIGGVAGVLRVTLTIAEITVSVRTPSDAGQSSASSMLLVAGVVGPLVSVGTLIVAYVKNRSVVARDEERFAKPFLAWLPVALLDITFTLLMILARTFANPF
jgi:hypothetical protein